MDFENNSNVIPKDKPEVGIVTDISDPRQIVNQEMLDKFRRAIEENIEAVEDYSGTEFPPAVICMNATEKGHEDLGNGAAVVGIEFTTQVYHGSDILPAENGVEMCHSAAMHAASDNIRPVTVFLASEAWVKRIEKEDELTKIERVRDCSDKQEAVILAGMTLGGLGCITVYNIDRDAEHRIKLTKNEELSSTTTTQGANALVEFYKTYASQISED